MFKISKFWYEKADGTERPVEMIVLDQDVNTYMRGIDLDSLSESTREELLLVLADANELLDYAIKDEHAFRQFKITAIIGDIETEDI